MEKIELPKKGNVVIIGYAATGKTTLADSLKFKGKLYHTDDYLKHGSVESLYVLMEDIGKDTSELKVIEGILGYRLLRKGLQSKGFKIGNFEADLIIICQSPKATRYARVLERSKDFQGILNQDKSCDRIWFDFVTLAEMHNIKLNIKTVTT